MKLIMMGAMEDAVKKHNVKAEPKEDDITSEAKKLAKTNKIMFDAHIEAGFTAEQAIQIVAAINN